MVSHLIPNSHGLAPMLSPRFCIILRITTQSLPSEGLNTEFGRWERRIDHLFNDVHANGSGYGLQLPCTLLTAVDTVRGNRGGLAFPLVKEVVSGIFELGGNYPIALGGNENKGVKGFSDPPRNQRNFIERFELIAL
jgi:hypothetical protein